MKACVVRLRAATLGGCARLAPHVGGGGLVGAVNRLSGAKRAPRRGPLMKRKTCRRLH